VVFISYSHESDEHKAAVRGLAERLRGDDFTVVIDQDQVWVSRFIPVALREEDKAHRPDFVSDYTCFVMHDDCAALLRLLSGAARPEVRSGYWNIPARNPCFFGREAYLELQRRMPPEERFARALELSELAIRFSEAGVRAAYPQATEGEVFLRAAAGRLPRELMMGAYHWDPDHDDAAR
jgi:hypothetical protein